MQGNKGSLISENSPNSFDGTAHDWDAADWKKVTKKVTFPTCNII